LVLAVLGGRVDADAEGADWREVARIVLHIDPDRESDRARRAFEATSLALSGWQGMLPVLASARLASRRCLTEG
jgi:hypothetical protein